MPPYFPRKAGNESLPDRAGAVVRFVSDGKRERAARFLVPVEFRNRADQGEAPAFVGQRFADGSAVRRDGAHRSVEDLPPAQAVELALRYDGV